MSRLDVFTQKIQLLFIVVDLVYDYFILIHQKIFLECYDFLPEQINDIQVIVNHYVQ